MLQSTIQQHPELLYRIDKFVVPAAARAEFMERVEMTHTLLRTFPGFRQDLMFEQTSGPGSFNFITLVVWESAAAMEAAKQAVQAHQQAIGFNPNELRERLQIQADIATYSSREGSYATH
ncbi:MAG: antibiotic biosynthesis monooxygenase [Caldilineaceae bacterium]|nr:antibiotic biosynthesis monooxygenase [Caldilineaceae bacterium]